MDITIEKKNFEKLNIEQMKSKCGQALDEIWNRPWMRYAVTRTDQECLPQVQSAAELLTNNSDAVVVLAEGLLAEQIRAAAAAVSPEEQKAEVIVFGETLSPSDYTSLLEKLENLRFSVLLVSDSEERLSLRGAYALLKKLLITKFGKEQAAERVAAVLGAGSVLFAQEAAAEDYLQISLPELTAEFAAGSAAVLLPLAIKGVDTKAYLDGFYEMLASPAWDKDAADYAVGRAVCGVEERLYVWQRQIEDFAALQGNTVFMPGAEGFRVCGKSGKSAGGQAEPFEILLLVEEDAADIMMPFFEGCNEDGSLNLLMRDSAREAFKNENPGVEISLPVMNDRNLGQLFAFFQLSEAITEYLLFSR